MDKMRLEEKPLDKTTFGRLKRMLESLEKTLGPRMDMDLSFEYVVGSLFPGAWDNIQKAISDAHMAGYLQALEDYNIEK